MARRPSRLDRYRQPSGFLAYYGTVICRHWIVFLPMLFVVPLAVGGLLGRGLGIQYLFRDQRSPFDAAFASDPWWWIPLRLFGSAYFETQGYAVALFGLLWTTSLLLEDKYARLNRTYLPNDSRVFHYLPGVALLGLLPLAAALIPLGRLVLYNSKTPAHMLLLPVLGYAFGLAFFYVMSKFAFVIADKLKVSKVRVVLILTVILIVIAAHIPLILPAKLMFIILASIVALYTLLQFGGPPQRVGWVVAILLAVMATNALRSEKYSFPELTVHYQKPLAERPNLKSYRMSARREVTPLDFRRRQTVSCRATNDELGTGLIDPILSLQRWYHRTVPPIPLTAQTGLPPPKQPKLVVVATSGGAYRASFWTARILENLLDGDKPGGDLPGFRHNIRLLTGASGGMVGSAYFAVEDPLKAPDKPIAQRIREDIRGSLVDRADWRNFGDWIVRNPMASDWDSLSPVARQMVLHDIPGFFAPFERPYDRGRELERHWKTLGTTFASLRDDEARGLRPSLVLSPTLADTGLPLLISNLDLDTVYRDKNEAVELFKLLPGTQNTLKVQTAVRMSATFPFISPSTRLPTNPPHRVVDAGYYDNFGVGIAVAYLAEPAIKAWLQRCTSGVMVVQIRAWPQDSTETIPGEPAKPGLISKWINTFAWLTTPIEGVANARATTNFYRNRRELCELQNIYRNPEAGPRNAVGATCQDDNDFLQTVEFEPEKLDDDATFTWDLQPQELEGMAFLLQRPNIVQARAALAKFWTKDLK